ncbi:2-amino-4-hydroxy-6-hydroxymethyldihydropteridine pyrophosphokinase [Candidatus Ruthia magnifica str. Cm (Calyptogena magnifica)]|uniref:2-amino-4-hydroxy-6-hydroxymethyldihydropteridine diphosphokinase n=1 Tax=Ruthia magnifica subsp. Calyptogena magnifica TaxID=413404 RepID=A1AXK8_RUTMC|nr:2-amino-4-hydroxy-6-hydroxymethyldihydropteridine diphosphokinase [Candidatus Ruthturnera calyptogenae]ABL02665.1 2-amino-4-hydroxy-6-hydroxymethyldihydropteridine pyrophosphokinase [Candidatus Ruthia magnifica str. Cm (Calyptogena magnifica)]
MANIHINIGSNQSRRKNLSKAIDTIKAMFENTVFSRVYESKAFGFEGNNFYNIGVNVPTNLTISEVVSIFHKIEDNLGRDRCSSKFSSRLIDLDLILYDMIIDKSHNLPRDDILKYNFVLMPLAELSPNLTHPQQHKTYTQLRATMDELKSYNIEILNKK